MYIVTAVQAVEEAESLIRRVLDEIGSAGLSGTTCTSKYLIEKTKASLDIIDSATSAFSLYNNDNTGTLSGHISHAPR